MAYEKEVISIYDNLYGYIKLDKEKYKKIIYDPFFLRLHNIKQMGLAHYIFPDALHTRFSHSLGVYFIVNKMLHVQKENYGGQAYKLNDSDIALIEMSALLHDIGHLPLSHTIEEALVRYEEQRDSGDDEALLEFSDEQSAKKSKTIKNGTKLHEDLGEHVLRNSSIGEYLTRTLDMSIEEVANRFKGNVFSEMSEEISKDEYESDKYDSLRMAKNFLHSQVDADRIDYLLRDSGFTGVKAGTFDFDKLLDEIRYDGKNNYGVNSEGVRALEQFLMGRFAAYSQIPFNKRVHSLNYMASDFYYRLLKAKEKNPDLFQLKGIYNYRDIIKVLETETYKFLDFTDSHFYRIIQMVKDDPDVHECVKNDYIIMNYAKLLSEGKPLKTVTHIERFCTEEEWKRETNAIRKLRQNPEYVERLAREAGLGINDIIIPQKSLCINIIDSEKDVIKIFECDSSPVNICDRKETYLSSLMDKSLYIDRIFTFDVNKQRDLQNELYKSEKWLL